MQVVGGRVNVFLRKLQVLVYRYLIPIKAGYVNFYIIQKTRHDSLLLTPFHLSANGYTLFFVFPSVAHMNKSKGSLTGEEKIYVI